MRNGQQREYTRFFAIELKRAIAITPNKNGTRTQYQSVLFEAQIGEEPAEPSTRIPDFLKVFDFPHRAGGVSVTASYWHIDRNISRTKCGVQF